MSEAALTCRARTGSSSVSKVGFNCLPMEDFRLSIFAEYRLQCVHCPSLSMVASNVAKVQALIVLKLTPMFQSVSMVGFKGVEGGL